MVRTGVFSPQNNDLQVSEEEGWDVGSEPDEETGVVGVAVR